LFDILAGLLAGEQERRSGMSEDSKTPSGALAGQEERSGPATPWLDLDPDKYRGEIADLQLTEDQEREFLETLWSIMSSFAQLGFETDICGAIFGEFNSVSGARSDALESKGSTHKETPSDGAREEIDHD
jgi:hypothetical protein